MLHNCDVTIEHSFVRVEHAMPIYGTHSTHWDTKISQNATVLISLDADDTIGHCIDTSGCCCVAICLVKITVEHCMQ